MAVFFDCSKKEDFDYLIWFRQKERTHIFFVQVPKTRRGILFLKQACAAKMNHGKLHWHLFLPFELNVATAFADDLLKVEFENNML